MKSGSFYSQILLENKTLALEFDPPIQEFCTTNTSTSLAYIQSTPNTNFLIQFGISDLKRTTEYQITITIDGQLIETSAHRVHAQGGVATVRGKTIKGEIYPFRFSKIETCEEEGELNELNDALGTIQVSFYRAEYGSVARPAVVTTSKDDEVTIKIDEKAAKLKFSELTTYDRAQAITATSRTGVVLLRVESEPACRFIFKYRSAALLDYLGIHVPAIPVLPRISISISPEPEVKPLLPPVINPLPPRPTAASLAGPIILPQHFQQISANSQSYYEAAKRRRAEESRLEERVKKPRVVEVDSDEDDLIILEFNGVKER